MRYEECETNNVDVAFKTGFLTVFYRRTEQSELVEGLVEGLVERLGERLGENQIKILELVNENPYISKREMSEEIGISTAAIDKISRSCTR